MQERLSEMIYSLNPTLFVSPATLNGRRHFVAEVRPDIPPLIIEDPAFLSCLNALKGQFNIDQARTVFSKHNLADDFERILSVLISEKIIINVGSKVNHTVCAVAELYHSAVRNFPFVQMDGEEGAAIDHDRMVEYLGAKPPPSPVLNITYTQTIALPEINPSRPPRSGLDRAALSFIFSYSSGIRKLHKREQSFPFVFKSVPSGGGRHPTELYVAIPDFLDGIESGLYHYQPDRLLLGRMPENINTPAILSAIRGESETAVASVFLSSRVERAMWRYRDARSARAIINDIGHVAGAIKSAARACGVQYRASEIKAPIHIAEALGTTVMKETFFHAGTISSI